MLSIHEDHMRAVGYSTPGPITAPDSLCDVELPRPTAAGRDLLVEVRAVSVNPVDCKVRASAPAPAGGVKVLGYDAAGVVAETGPGVTLFKTGDEVFYAGSIARSGTNAEFHLVDERIVGRKPRSLGFAEAAALPLTAITAWETLFDRIDIRRSVPGGARRGPHHRRRRRRRLDRDPARPRPHRPLGHRHRRAARDPGLGEESRRPPRHRSLKAAGARGRRPRARRAALRVLYHAHARSFERHRRTDRAQGRLGLINGEPLELSPFMRKSVSIHWESMFTRSLLGRRT